MRRFQDDVGIEWEVREICDPTLSVVPQRLLRQPAFGNGWLLFTCGTERRRLAPYPTDWHGLSEYELQCWCRRAQPAQAPRLDHFLSRAAPPARERTAGA